MPFFRDLSLDAKNIRHSVNIVENNDGKNNECNDDGDQCLFPPLLVICNKHTKSCAKKIEKQFEAASKVPVTNCFLSFIPPVTGLTIPLQEWRGEQTAERKAPAVWSFTLLRNQDFVSMVMLLDDRVFRRSDERLDVKKIKSANSRVNSSQHGKVMHIVREEAAADEQCRINNEKGQK